MCRMALTHMGEEGLCALYRWKINGLLERCCHLCIDSFGPPHLVPKITKKVSFDIAQTLSVSCPAHILFSKMINFSVGFSDPAEISDSNSAFDNAPPSGLEASTTQKAMLGRVVSGRKTHQSALASCGSPKITYPQRRSDPMARRRL